MTPEKMKLFLLRCAYWGSVTVVIVLCLRYLLFMLLPFLIGFLIAYLLRPLTSFISRHSKITVKSASIVSAVLFYSLLSALLWLSGSWLVLEGERLLAALPSWYLEAVEPVLQTMYRQTTRFLQVFSTQSDTINDELFAQISQGFQSGLGEVSEKVLSGLTDALRSLPLLLLALLFTIVSSVLICADYGQVTRFVLAQVPARLHSTLLGIRDFLIKTAGRMLKAYLILMVITFGELTLGLCILRVEGFVVIAALIALLDLLPILGSGAVLIPWGLYQLCEANYFTGFGLLILWALLSVVRQVLEPKIVGQQLGLHPLVTLSAMYCGAYLAGFWGLLVAPVLCLLVKYLQGEGLVKVYRPLPPA